MSHRTERKGREKRTDKQKRKQWKDRMTKTKEKEKRKGETVGVRVSKNLAKKNREKMNSSSLISSEDPASHVFDQQVTNVCRAFSRALDSEENQSFHWALNQYETVRRDLGIIEAFGKTQCNEGKCFMTPFTWFCVPCQCCNKFVLC